MTRTALIAGAGALPPILFGALEAQGEAPVVCELHGQPTDLRGEMPRLNLRLETLGTFIAELRGLGVSRICMAGAITRPAIDLNAIDAATLPLVPRLTAALARGDDGALRIIIEIFEEAGFDVIGAHEVAPELLPPVGVLTGALPKNIGADLAAAEAALDEMGLADLGQAVVARHGVVVAREDATGTDALLAGLEDAAGGILFKAPKPGQELRVDMPVIGAQTARAAAHAGLSGIVVAAGQVMVPDRLAMQTELEKSGLFLWVRA